MTPASAHARTHARTLTSSHPHCTTLFAAEVAFWSWCISFAIPMLLDEVDPALPIGPPLLMSFGHRAVLDLLLGASGAAAFPHLGPTSLNVLDAVAVHPQCGPVTRAAGILFVVFSLAPNVVDYAMARRRSPLSRPSAP